MNKVIIIFVGTKDVLAIIEKVKTIEQDSFDLFLSFLLIHSSGCRSPPNPFNFEILKLNGGN